MNRDQFNAVFLNVKHALVFPDVAIVKSSMIKSNRYGCAVLVSGSLHREKKNDNVRRTARRCPRVYQIF